jgi:uncharacterized membrane protein ArfB
MDFVIQWLWYLLAFVVGSAVAWLIRIRRAGRVHAVAQRHTQKITGTSARAGQAQQ